MADGSAPLPARGAEREASTGHEASTPAPAARGGSADIEHNGSPGRVRSGSADPAALVESARSGDARALARLVSLVENRSPQLRPVMKLVAPLAGGARVIGLTGSPGVGKSTVTGALVRAYRDRGLRVGVLAIDPTSPFTGGALLGDRVRMQDHATDASVFIRSMASRGHLGGLSWATPQALRILDAAGFDVILIETVGVGQDEVEIASLADSTLVVVAPGMGDSIQAAKAGILEIADIFVVNKSDRPGAQEVIRDLRTMLAMARFGEGAWKPPIVATTASAGKGIDDLAGQLDAHGAWLGQSGDGDRRRRARARAEISAIADAELRRRLGGLPHESRLDELAGRVASGELDPYTAADDLLGAE